MKQKLKMEFTLSGFIIALVLIGMLASSLALFTTELNTQYNLEGNTTLSNYDSYDSLKGHTDEIQANTKIEQDTGILDMIGAYFSKGYAAVMIATTSFDVFTEMGNQASADNEYLCVGDFCILDYLTLIVIVAIFIGIIISVLVKMRI